MLRTRRQKFEAKGLALAEGEAELDELLDAMEEVDVVEETLAADVADVDPLELVALTEDDTEEDAMEEAAEEELTPVEEATDDMLAALEAEEAAAELTVVEVTPFDDELTLLDELTNEETTEELGRIDDADDEDGAEGVDD